MDDQTETSSEQTRSVEAVVPIENTVKFDEHTNYLDRYFVSKYFLNLNQQRNDHCILIHSNRLCVLTLAPSHPIVRGDLSISKVDFQISKNVNRLDNKTSGKRKRNAQNVSLNSPICFVECSNDERFTISSPIPGKLLEINEKLQTNPELLRLCYRENYYKECYIAVIIPKHNVPMEEVTKNLIDESQYQASLLGSA